LDVGFRADIIMEGKLVVEIKSIEHLEKVHHKTVLTYLKLAGIKLAILVNFNVNLIKDGIYRKIQGELMYERMSFVFFASLWDKNQYEKTKTFYNCSIDHRNSLC
jgi:PD-(D/E)XK nuclease superfamily